MCLGRGWRCCYMVQPAHHPWTITSLHSRARATRGVRRPTGAPHSTIHALQRQTNSRDRCIFIRGMFRSARAHSERNPPHVETTDYTLDNRWPHRTTYHHGVLLVHARTILTSVCVFAAVQHDAGGAGGAMGASSGRAAGTHAAGGGVVRGHHGGGSPRGGLRRRHEQPRHPVRSTSHSPLPLNTMTLHADDTEPLSPSIDDRFGATRT